LAHELPFVKPELPYKINLSLNDGVFALRVDTFKKYFAGFGVVK
jgi:hypothetical protein